MVVYHVPSPPEGGIAIGINILSHLLDLHQTNEVHHPGNNVISHPLLEPDLLLQADNAQCHHQRATTLRVPHLLGVTPESPIEAMRLI